MNFKCTLCKKEQESLSMFGKFVDNKDGMEDDGEYCHNCFYLRCIKYKIEKSNSLQENNEQKI